MFGNFNHIYTELSQAVDKYSFLSLNHGDFLMKLLKS